MNPLFACSRCFKRIPFEEIFTSSNNDMFCGDCRNATLKFKCNYCRSEFQNTNKSSTSTCPKCTENLKLYGKPTACTLCSLNAAFKTDKCLRCISSTQKYGPPVKCEICQQTCAFNRSDLRIDGKLHCWLCKLSYKRALAKSKAKNSDRERAKKRPADESALKSSSSSKFGNQGTSNNRNNNSGNSASQRDLSGKTDIPEKLSKTSNSVIAPSHTSDHVVAMTQLREQIATLQKKLQQKDSQLLQKDKEITEWKSKHFTIENEMRNRMTEQKKVSDMKLDTLNKKVQNQQVQIAQLSKLSGKRTIASAKEAVKEREKDNNNSSPNNSDSPNTN